MAKPKKIGVPISRLLKTIAELKDYGTIAELVLNTSLLEDAMNRREITPIEMVIGDLCAYYWKYKQGLISLEEINMIMGGRSHLPSVTIPLVHFEAIMMGFSYYYGRGGEIELGEAFNLEGGGQGKRKKIERLLNLKRDLAICGELDAVRAEAEMSGAPISIDAAIDALAETYAAQKLKSPPSVDVIRRAHKLYGERVRAVGTANLIGGATS